jgi:LPS-assembly protein
MRRPNHPAHPRSSPVYALQPIAWAVGLCVHAGVYAQAPEPAPQLKSSPLLQESVPADVRSQLPSFIQGDRLTGRPDLETVIDGNAELRRGDTVIRADRLEYYQPDDLAKARGNVYINRSGNIFEGPELQLRIDAFEGYFLRPRYQFIANQTHGEAERVDFIDDQRVVARNATLTSCRREPGPSWVPDWVLKASTVKFDNETETGEAENAQLRFKDVPILATPYLTFPLSDKRKSGMLPPTINVDSLSGVELTLPYYWDIAPNRDATLYPTLMAKRGLDLGGEFRYLENDYQGQFRGAVTPHDRLRSRERWGVAYRHSQNISTGWAAAPNLGLSIDLNRVSDDNYWRDFPRATTSLTQRLLANDVNLNAAAYGWTFGARALKWQTLQDTSSPITPPYDRLPNLTANYTRSNVSGFDFSFTADTSRFQSSPALTGQPNGQRSYLLGQVSRPWVAPGWFVTPKLQLHATRYGFDGSLSGGQTAASRTVPTFSIDSGLVFERPANYLGRDVLQTLEPRAFYTRTPFRDQNFLPNYDSAENDFNFATIWSENAFGGHDRISDTNVLTLGLGSRFLEPQTGAELAHLRVAQRLRFSDQNVVLPGGLAATEKFSDTLLGATLNWTDRWAFDSTVQFNTELKRSVRTTLGGRYSPSNYRVVNAAYRLQRGSSEQLDVGWQWPLNDLWGDRGEDKGPGVGLGPGRWYSVGRMNYSVRDKKLVDTIVGLEYDAGCWVSRVVLERLARSGTSANTRILFQLELVGFSRLGSNPLKTLQQNIPRYQLLREKTTAPSRFSTYE